MSLVTIATRAITRRSMALARTQFRPVALRALATKHENPEGDMMEGYQEFLDDLKAQTDKMETSLGDLKTTYGKKQEAILRSSTIKWMDPEEIEGLFDIAGRQKKEMEEQLEAMKKSIEAMKTNFAVDGPDGESDGHMEEELEAVKHIIEDSAGSKKAA